MEYVTLGNSGIKVSQIGLGIWQASSDWKGNDDEITMALAKSLELGINLVDTAEAYGNGHSEEVLGRSLKILGRDNFVIATKVYGAHLRYDELQRAAHASMKRLGVSEIDLYQVHWPDPWQQIPLKHTMNALEKLYLEGKIRAIGVSNFAVRDLEEARSCLSRTDIVTNQLRYNLLQTEIEEEVLPYSKREGIRVLAWSPLAQGALTGKYNKETRPQGDVREENVLFTPQNLEESEKLLSVLLRIAKTHGATMSQVSLNWLETNPLVIPIPGAKNSAQAEENAGSVSLKLTPEELDEIEFARRQVKIDYLPQTGIGN